MKDLVIKTKFNKEAFSKVFFNDFPIVSDKIELVFNTNSKRKTVDFEIRLTGLNEEGKEIFEDCDPKNLIEGLRTFVSDCLEDEE